MKIYVFLVMMLCLPVFAGPSAFAQQEPQAAFFQNLNDVPLMPGLYEMVDEGLVFDKAEGRVVESSAATETQTAAAIKAFYSKTLPQFGWKQTAAGRFMRGAEILQFEVVSDGPYNIVHFSVAPKD